MTTPAPILAENLGRRYEDRWAVRGVDLAVEAGEVVALLGPNGAGKTTLLRMLAGILAPSEGRASVAGHDVASSPASAKRALGFLSGDTQLYGRLSVREVLRYFGRLHGLDTDEVQRRTESVSASLDLSTLLDQRVSTLSSGQTQRANLARTLLAEPRVIILDEPTTALDVVSGHFVHETLVRARCDGRAILLSTHIMSEAEHLADRIVLLVRGRVAACGTQQQLLERYDASSLTELVVELHRAPEA